MINKLERRNKINVSSTILNEEHGISLWFHQNCTYSFNQVTKGISIAKSMMILSSNLLFYPYPSTPITLVSLLFLAHSKHTSTLWLGIGCSFCLEHSSSGCQHSQLPFSFNLYANVIFSMGPIMTTRFTIAASPPFAPNPTYPALF